MNQIIIFSTIVLIVLRAVNTVVCGNFYKVTKNLKYLILGIGWLLWEISGFTALFLVFVENEIYMYLIIFHNAILSLSAIIFLCYGFNLFFIEVSKKILIYTISVIVVMNYMLLFVFGFPLTIRFCSLILNIIWISNLIFLLIKLKKDKIILETPKKGFLYSIVGMIIAYLPIGILIQMKGYSFGLYFAEDTLFIILNYGYLFLLTVLLTIFTIYLEFKLSDSQKYVLKDKYSHDLGNALQSIYMAIEILEERILNQDESSELKELLERKRKEASDLLKEIRDL